METAWPLRTIVAPPHSRATPLRALIPRGTTSDRTRVKLIGSVAGDADSGAFDLCLNEEFALLHGDGASTEVPWGDGEHALAFDGLMKRADSVWSILSPRLAASRALAQIVRRGGDASSSFVLLSRDDIEVGDGLGYEVFTSRFLEPGIMLVGSMRWGKYDSAVVNVLPQVPGSGASDYTATPLADTGSGQRVMVSVYEVLEVAHPECFVKVTLPLRRGVFRRIARWIRTHHGS